MRPDNLLRIIVLFRPDRDELDRTARSTNAFSEAPTIATYPDGNP